MSRGSAAGRLLPAMAIVMAALATHPTARAGEVHLDESFDGAAIDWCIFQSKQADADYLALGSETLGGVTTSFLANTVDASYKPWDIERPRLRCPRPLPAAVGAADEKLEADPLGPSFFAPPAGTAPLAAAAPSLANCPSPLSGVNPVTGKTQTIFERNELRLRDHLKHGVREGHWYGLRFRALGAVPSCGSMRSVVAQWKFEYDDDRDDDDDQGINANGRSPVFALRFDNGVLHATVQNHLCRCLVAKAVGDPDFTVPPGPAVTSSVAAADQELVDLPLRCVPISPAAPDLTCPRPGFEAKYLRPVGSNAAQPVLPDPREGWVDIAVYIEGTSDRDWPNGGRVELYANGVPIVRLSDGIGYSDVPPTDTKFKFGHYRDRILAGARLDYDRLCIAPTNRSCGPAKTFDDHLR